MTDNWFAPENRTVLKMELRFQKYKHYGINVDDVDKWWMKGRDFPPLAEDTYAFWHTRLQYVDSMLDDLPTILNMKDHKMVEVLKTFGFREDDTQATT